MPTGSLVDKGYGLTGGGASKGVRQRYRATCSGPGLHGAWWETEQQCGERSCNQSPFVLGGDVRPSTLRPTAAPRAQKDSNTQDHMRRLLLHCTIPCADTNERKHATARSVPFPSLPFLSLCPSFPERHTRTCAHVTHERFCTVDAAVFRKQWLLSLKKGLPLGSQEGLAFACTVHPLSAQDLFKDTLKSPLSW